MKAYAGVPLAELALVLRELAKGFLLPKFDEEASDKNMGAGTSLRREELSDKNIGAGTPPGMDVDESGVKTAEPGAEAGPDPGVDPKPINGDAPENPEATDPRFDRDPPSDGTLGMEVVPVARVPDRFDPAPPLDEETEESVDDPANGFRDARISSGMSRSG